MTTMSFADLMKSRESVTADMIAELQKQNAPMQYAEADDRFWFPKTDEAGNGRALIRFIPNKFDVTKSWVRYWEHAFQGPTGSWYIEKSLTTIGKPDPIAEYNSELWNSGSEANKNIARNQKRNLRYVANIVVLKEPSAPEREGKVFLFRFGKQIFDKIDGVMLPPQKEGPDEETLSDIENKVLFNPFDVVEGANFLLKVRKKTQTNAKFTSKNGKVFPTYEDSAFEKQSPLFGGDEAKMAAAFAATHDLSEFIAESAFKSYEELKARRDRVFGLAGTSKPNETEGKGKPLADTFSGTTSEDDDEADEMNAIFERLKKSSD